MGTTEVFIVSLVSWLGIFGYLLYLEGQIRRLKEK
ncbi:MAG: CcmD family protein [Limnochordia bacterium]